MSKFSYTTKSVSALNAKAIKSSEAHYALLGTAILASTAFGMFHGNTVQLNELFKGLQISDRADMRAFLRNLNAECVNVFIPEEERAVFKAMSEKPIGLFNVTKEGELKIQTSEPVKALKARIIKDAIASNAEEPIQHIVDILATIQRMTDEDEANASKPAFNPDKTFKQLVRKIIAEEKDEALARSHAYAINKLISEGRFSQTDIDLMFKARAEKHKADMVAETANDTGTPSNVPALTVMEAKENLEVLESNQRAKKGKRKAA